MMGAATAAWLTLHAGLRVDAGRSGDDCGHTRYNTGRPCSGRLVDSGGLCGRIPGTYRAAGSCRRDNTGTLGSQICKRRN